MTWTGPGFIEAHAHALRHAADTLRAVNAESRTIEGWHREVASRGSTPMDEPALPPPSDLATRLRGALDNAAAVGIVELTEAGITDWSFVETLLRMRDEAPFPVAVRLMIASGLALQAGAAGVAARCTGDPWLEITGIKLYADGWLGPRTCCLREPFVDRPGDAGICFLDTDELVRRATPFAEAGLVVHTHAIGDRAIDNVLDAYHRVWGGDVDAIRAAAPRIEHAQVLHHDLIARMAEMGIVVCIQPSFGVTDARHVRAALDGEAAAMSYNWQALVDAGVSIVTGSDYPIEPLDPLIGLQHLVTGAPLDDPDNVVAPTLSFDTAFSLMTDDARGSVELSADPRTTAPSELHRIAVIGSQPTPNWSE